MHAGIHNESTVKIAAVRAVSGWALVKLCHNVLEVYVATSKLAFFHHLYAFAHAQCECL